SSEYCCAGTCCPPASACCNDNCTPLGTDQNCSGCGDTCTGGKTCSGEKCVCPLRLPDDCHGVCTNFSSDPQHCGGCDSRACPAPANSTATCSNGVCGFVCNAGFAACGNNCCPLVGSACCNGNCTPLRTNQNCSGCGDRCVGGTTCCNNRCTPLGTNQNCSSCGDRCAGGTTCCNNVCADVKSNP